MSSSKKKRSRKKKRSPAAKETQTAVNDREGGNEFCPKRHTDEEMFGMGYESFLGECPICDLTMPLDRSQYSLTACCSKHICFGCAVASQLADEMSGRKKACAFCRTPLPEVGPRGNEKLVALVQKRVEARDSCAITMMGQFHVSGEYGVQRNVVKGIDLWKEAAKLGNAEAHCHLALSYDGGDFGLKKDMSKAVYHYEAAAIAGHFEARHGLGFFEKREGRFNRALRHWMVSATMGYEDSLKGILELLKDGHATRDDYVRALHGYRNATDEMSSSERDIARMIPQRWKGC